MEEYIGLDVSMKETSVSIRRTGERIWRGKCASDPRIIAELIRKRAPAVKRVVFETGPLSVWFYHSLRTEGLPAIFIDARHAKAALGGIGVLKIGKTLGIGTGTVQRVLMEQPRPFEADVAEAASSYQ